MYNLNKFDAPLGGEKLLSNRVNFVLPGGHWAGKVWRHFDCHIYWGGGGSVLTYGG